MLTGSVSLAKISITVGKKGGKNGGFRGAILACKHRFSLENRAAARLSKACCCDLIGRHEENNGEDRSEHRIEHDQTDYCRDACRGLRATRAGAEARAAAATPAAGGQARA